jgi:HEPN domain-containing protein
MKRETSEWVSKAEGDFISAKREFSAPENPNFDAACFHARQCAEKYLKARLVEAGRPFPKIHDLGALLNLVLPLEPLWESLRDELEGLTALGGEVRYPGMTADREDAEEAVRTAEHVRKVVRVSLGLD